MAARSAWGETTASAVRLTPEATRPCNTPRWRNSLASEPNSLVHRRQVLLRTSAAELAHRVGFRTSCGLASPFGDPVLIA
eukprot:15440160-Alexandrium_andersonii.AAC.1